MQIIKFFHSIIWLLLSLTLYSQTYNVALLNLGHRTGFESELLVSDESGFFVSSSNHLMPSYHLTKVGLKNASVQIDMPMEGTFVDFKFIGNNLQLLTSHQNGSVLTLKSTIFDTTLNVLDSSSLALPAYVKITSAIHATSDSLEITAFQAHSNDSASTPSIIFMNTTTMSDEVIFEYPGECRLYGFCAYEDGYLIRASVEDTTNFGNETVSLFGLDDDFQIIFEIPFDNLSYPVDTVVLSSHQRFGYWTSLLATGNQTAYMSSTAQNFYYLSNGMYYEDADPIILKINLETQTPTDSIILHDFYENEFFIHRHLQLTNSGDVVAASSFGGGFTHQIGEHHDSGIRLSLFSSDLHQTWERSFFENDGKYQRVNQVQVLNNGYVVVGSSHDPMNDSSELFIIRTDVNGMITSTSQPVAEGVSVFPVPSTETVHIVGTLLTSDNYQVVNLDGRAFHCPLLDRNRISINELTPGVYFIRIGDTQTSTVLRFVKT